MAAAHSAAREHKPLEPVVVLHVTTTHHSHPSTSASASNASKAQVKVQTQTEVEEEEELVVSAAPPSLWAQMCSWPFVSVLVWMAICLFWANFYVVCGM